MMTRVLLLLKNLAFVVLLGGLSDAFSGIKQQGDYYLWDEV